MGIMIGSAAKVLGVVTAAYMIYTGIPTVYYKYFYSKKAYSNPIPGRKILRLTFDDGPDEKYTEQLLDVLKEHQIPATFFLITDKIKQSSHILHRMIEEGHDIGLHCRCHTNPLRWGPKRTQEDLQQGIKNMEDFGLSVRYYRPPHGNVNLSMLYQIRKQGLRLVLWEVLIGDWKEGLSSEEILLRLRKHTQNGSLICLHDGENGKERKSKAPGNTIEALRTFIPYMKEQGYEFRTVESIR